MPRSITQNAAEVGAAVGAQFVVDTTGRVERGTIRFLPGTQAPAARAASAAMRDWRFTPAEIDGTPVEVWDTDEERGEDTANLVSALWDVMPSGLQVWNVEHAGGPTPPLSHRVV